MKSQDDAFAKAAKLAKAKGKKDAKWKKAPNILYYTLLYYTILYYTTIYYTILYYTILYSTILYYTILY